MTDKLCNSPCRNNVTKPAGIESGSSQKQMDNVSPCMTQKALPRNQKHSSVRFHMKMTKSFVRRAASESERRPRNMKHFSLHNGSIKNP